MNDRDIYVEKMKATLDEWNAEISRLSAKADIAAADAKLEYNARIEKIKDDREAARKKLNELQSAGESAWSDLRKGMEEAADSVSTALRDAASRFR